jgi:hypothetical protein
MGATALALELFYILASAYLAVFHSSVDVANQPPPLERIAGAFAVWLISIQTYGLLPVALSFPFSLLYGSIAGAVILKARNTGSGVPTHTATLPSK